MPQEQEEKTGPPECLAGDGLREVLSSVVEEVRRGISRDIDGAQLLHGLLSSSWLPALLRVYECLLQFQSLSPCPLVPQASDLSHEVLASLEAVSSPSAEAQELYRILSTPHLQALLSAHDSVGQSEFDPVLPPLPDDLPEDEQAMRIICLVKNQQPLGATIKKDEETGEIVIARVIHGGLADRSGLLHPGDLLVEVNGSPVVGLEPEEIIQILIQSEGSIFFKVIPNSPQLANSQTLLYMRAMADYCPLQDPYIPCPDAGIAFNKGDLLEIVDQTDVHWWQARKLPTTSYCAGLIPSTGLFKSKQREQWWSQPSTGHHCIKLCETDHIDNSNAVDSKCNEESDQTEDSKTADDKCSEAEMEQTEDRKASDDNSIVAENSANPLSEEVDSNDSEEEAEEDESHTTEDGVYIAGFRHSLRLCKRKAFRRRRQSCCSCSTNSSALSNPYEEVAVYDGPLQDLHRLIILVGVSGVGVNTLRKQLIELNAATFQGPVPHTTRPPREGEQMGLEYNFVTREQFEDMISTHRFLEYGEHKSHLYGTSYEAVSDVQDTGRICVVDVEPHHIPALRTKVLKPYVIFVKPPSLDRLRATRSEARIFTGSNVIRRFKEEDFVELEESSKLIEVKYSQFFDSVIVNDGLQDSVKELFTAIMLAQEGPQWIPASWLGPDEPQEL